MSMPKPQDIKEYCGWLEISLGIKCDAVQRKHYEVVAKSLQEQTENSAFWRTVKGQIGEFDSRYLKMTKHFLFMKSEVPEIHWKPHDSILDKSFRKNVIENSRWPDPLEGGWITPRDWCSRVNDPIRTVMVVKYLDGVSFLVGELETLAQNHGLRVRSDFEAREEGYYAAHTYVTMQAEIPNIRWDTEKIEFDFEIQTTTQFQEAIRPLTHPFYVARRSRTDPPETKWQWEFKTDEFRVNYLAHTLHHVEGLIVDVRDRETTGR